MFTVNRTNTKISRVEFKSPGNVVRVSATFENEVSSDSVTRVSATISVRGPDTTNELRISSKSQIVEIQSILGSMLDEIETFDRTAF